MEISYKYFFDAIRIVNKQPRDKRAAFYFGVYDHQLTSAPTPEIRARMETYRTKEMAKLNVKVAA